MNNHCPEVYEFEDFTQKLPKYFHHQICGPDISIMIGDTNYVKPISLMEELLQYLYLLIYT